MEPCHISDRMWRGCPSTIPKTGQQVQPKSFQRVRVRDQGLVIRGRGVRDQLSQLPTLGGCILRHDSALRHWSLAPGLCSLSLRYLHQLHLAVAPAMQHKRVSRCGAEDQQIAVAKLGIFDGFLNGHRLNRNSIAVFNDVRLNHCGARRKGMNRNGCSRVTCQRGWFLFLGLGWGSTRVLGRATGGAVSIFSTLGRRLFTRRRSW